MRVLHVSGAKGWGGNEQQLLDMIPELQNIGVENYIYGLDNSILRLKAKDFEIPFLIAKAAKLNKFVNYKDFNNVVKNIKPHVIHLHTSDALTVYTISDFFYKHNIKTVFSKKGMGSSSSFLSKIKYNYKGLNKVICVSEAVLNSFTKIINKKNKHKLMVIYDGINIKRVAIPNALNLREHFKINANKSILANIANHVKAKDLPTLIKAINYLVNELHFRDFHLVQIGEFSKKWTPETLELIETFGLQKFITLAGFQNNAQGFLEQCDAYVMSSEREGLPLTIYEAFYKGVPVVSTKAGGIPEAIEDNYNGFLVEVADFKGLAHKIKTLLENIELQSKFKEHSEALFFQKFTSNVNAEKTYNLYKDLID